LIESPSRRRFIYLLFESSVCTCLLVFGQEQTKLKARTDLVDNEGKTALMQASRRGLATTDAKLLNRGGTE